MSGAIVISGLPAGYDPPGRPERKLITFTLDGSEVQAPEGIMLVDAAKYGDVEIPVFCYEPKLGQPVGACRMCLVEIEGIPKLQTACSTPVKDGMSVVTRSDRVREAQNTVVEFLLVNHPLDCPVCDKGGECPLQDISFGWGRGESRFTEPKRHFEKPIALSPTIAIDRERCILCYRCVRYSQEVADDYQLVLLERGDHSYVGTFDGHPYIAPFAGNVIELCPVGALTSRPYRFRARPWDVEQGGSVCTLCPAQCNVAFTVRDERVMRVLQRDNAEVDDGWLCDKGRFAYQSWATAERVTEPLLRENGELRPVSWERAIAAAAAGLKEAGATTAALAGGQTTNEEGWLLARLLREGLGSPHLDARPGGVVEVDVARTLADPALTAAVPDIEWADAVLVLDTELVDEAAILDLRVRKGVRRNGVKLCVATARPSALDERAETAARYAPGAAEAFVQALIAALGEAGADTADSGDVKVSVAGSVDDLAASAGADPGDVRATAATLAAAGRVVVIWGETAGHGDRGPHCLRAICNLADRLGLAATPGAGMIEIPSSANGRGLREIGFAPNLGPGLAALDPAATGRSTAEIGAALRDGELSALVLAGRDPLGEFTDRRLWEAALARAATVVAFANWLDESAAAHADVVFPAESNAEKEGTVTHPDGRVQRLRQTVARAGEVRPVWQVLADLARAVGVDTGVLTAPMVTAQITAAVPFYAELTLDEIGPRGARWQARPAAAALPAPARRVFTLDAPPDAPSPNGRLRLGTFRPLWSGGDVINAESIAFLAAGQRLELSPADGERLGVASGDEVTVAAGDEQVRATVALRAAVPAGSAFLIAAGGDQSGALLTNGAPALVEVRR